MSFPHNHKTKLHTCVFIDISVSSKERFDFFFTRNIGVFVIHCTSDNDSEIDSANSIHLTVAIQNVDPIGAFKKILCVTPLDIKRFLVNLCGVLREESARRRA
jgi:hypothetical protein